MQAARADGRNAGDVCLAPHVLAVLLLWAHELARSRLTWMLLYHTARSFFSFSGKQKRKQEVIKCLKAPKVPGHST